MTVSSTTNRASASGDGSTHSFAYGFKIFADTDLTVIVRASTGSETTKTLNTEYVVTGAGEASGGTVLFKYNTTENIGLYIFGGFLIQILLEYFSQGIEHGHFHKSNVLPFSVLISLCLHALLEGIPLGGELEEHTHNALLSGIVLHKLPVAIVLMTFFLQSNMKKSKAYILLFIFAMAWS